MRGVAFLNKDGTRVNLRTELVDDAGVVVPSLPDDAQFILQNQSTVTIYFDNAAAEPGVNASRFEVLPKQFIGFKVKAGSNPYAWTTGGNQFDHHKIVVGELP